MDLTGFVAFDFSQGVPYFSITANGLTFNKAVAMKLGLPAHARLLINTEAKQVALQACEETTPQAIQFYRQKKNGAFSVRWNSQDLLATFKDLLKSDLQHGFRVDGKLVEPGLMLFDLEDARPLD